jgi:putative transposase
MIFVRDHTRGMWIEAEWSLAKQTLAPFSLDVLRAARRAAAHRGDTAAGVDVLAEINRIQTGRAKTIKEHKAAQRDSVNTPVIAPSPDVAESEPHATTSTPDPAPRSRRRRAARRIDDADQD